MPSSLESSMRTLSSSSPSSTRQTAVAKTKPGRKRKQSAVSNVYDDNTCAFCHRIILEEHAFEYGQRESSKKHVVHYFCLLLADGLPQKGADTEGIKGFLDGDIANALRRASRKRCFYCGKPGATAKCAKAICTRSFHLPCGLEAKAVPDFNPTSFEVLCGVHAQPPVIVPLLGADRTAECLICLNRLELSEMVPPPPPPPPLPPPPSMGPAEAADGDDAHAAGGNSSSSSGSDDDNDDGRRRLNVSNALSFDLLVSPCCRQLYEKRCLRTYANVAGLHHFRCCRCRNSAQFLYVCRQNGIFVPDQDAAWEREDLFADHYRPHEVCDIAECLCPTGRDSVEDHADWEVVRCGDCGKSGTHIKCSELTLGPLSPFQCADCASVVVTRSTDAEERSISVEDSDDSDIEVVSSTYTPELIAQRRQNEVCQLEESSAQIRRLILQQLTKMFQLQQLQANEREHRPLRRASVTGSTVTLPADSFPASATAEATVAAAASRANGFRLGHLQRHAPGHSQRHTPAQNSCNVERATNMS